ncbi:hypothetical protein AXG93_1913s1290 [Marchantia polymorpha subsp. ruderalis]|uniref:Uncharacterized protein n=1 Tax=Marchantia polymorpha subsp. ruderalis TaxID=1480154 RepID=A0A176WIU3_MARPO|nr:hypothetical protein AXG93_1913s1290 [Marchantia polymorpha subsp. ruderalis]
MEWNGMGWDGWGGGGKEELGTGGEKDGGKEDLVLKKERGSGVTMSYAEDEGSGRPKLSLQPRGSGADQAPSTPSKTSKA